jgi:hypothetical protein
VEDGIEPVDTAFDYVENKVILSPDAAQRRGIQAVIAVTVNGSDRAEAAVGEAVELELRATARSCPPTGTSTAPASSRSATTAPPALRRATVPSRGRTQHPWAPTRYRHHMVGPRSP